MYRSRLGVCLEHIPNQLFQGEIEMAKNLENRVFGRLKAISKTDSHITSGGNIQARWLCLCSCGNEKIVTANSLLQGRVKSCGCWLRDSSRELGFLNRKHGGYSKLSSPQERIRQQALANIRERSRRNGYESDLEVADLPELTNSCPVLGVLYTKGSLKNKDFSPSIDRKNPNLPYLKKYKGNLTFISHKANRIKSNASVEDVTKVLQYMTKGTQC
jgi:hypothetical protein